MLKSTPISVFHAAKYLMKKNKNLLPEFLLINGKLTFGVRKRIKTYIQEEWYRMQSQRLKNLLCAISLK